MPLRRLTPEASRDHTLETGLYYYRARYYDPTLAHFVSEDPIGLSGGINPYASAGNDPVNATDPWGLCPGRWEGNTFIQEGICEVEGTTVTGRRGGNNSGWASHRGDRGSSAPRGGSAGGGGGGGVSRAADVISEAVQVTGFCALEHYTGISGWGQVGRGVTALGIPFPKRWANWGLLTKRGQTQHSCHERPLSLGQLPL